jgi:Tfp pilus assembly protein PilW
MMIFVSLRPINDMKDTQAKGFTIVETLIYTVLLALIMSSVVLLTTATIRTKAKEQATAMLSQNLRFALNLIAAQVSQSSDITSPASGASSSMILATTSSSTNPVTFSLSSTTLMMAQAAGTAVSVTSNEVDITSLSFTRFTGTPASVRIVMSGKVHNAQSAWQATLTVTSTATIRR